VSDDGGEDWGCYFPGLGSDILTLAVDPVTTANVYAGTDGGGVFQKMSGGVWSSLNDGLESLTIRALAIDPITPDVLYAGTPGGIYKSTNAGENWSSVNTGLIFYNVLTLAIDPQTPSTLYAGTSRAIYKTTTGGENWFEISSFLIPGVDVLALEIDPLNPNTLYLGIHNRRPPPPGYIASFPDDGMYKSTDGGENWMAFDSGLPYSAFYTLAVDPQNPNIIHAGTNAGVFSIQQVGIRLFLPLIQQQ